MRRPPRGPLRHRGGGARDDAEAVLHAAWQLAHPGQTPPRAADVRGDRPTIAEPLRKLGFFVLNTREDGGAEPPLGREPEDYVDAASRLNVLDRAGSATSRAEQALLRGAQGLLTGSPRDCGLCGRQLPPALLVAAHIKRRADRDPDERRDVLNVAMRACALGCDALFEHGRVQVDSAGTVRVRVQGMTDDLAAHLRGLADRRAPAYRPERAKYFAWHQHQHRAVR